MDTHHLKAVITPAGLGSTIELDGQQIQDGVAGIELHAHVGEFSSATIELSAPTLEVDGELRIALDEKTQAALKQLGWTPPA